ncbi:hypothetical protein NP522_15235 [Pseudomonas guariconensis]|uniref:hypothetical protein n=1 Tax=Pseudomonas TaxID=286 RepID=UPI0008A179C1|nr:MULTISPECIES: hypothetical protein [Pseudomonas]MDD2091534.1 hypothetical protein [Pseudomonas guariconensis]OFS77494.1 hypothetical protein HMPREF3173_01130 [Pseudomonas sp. HMSC08G10]
MKNNDFAAFVETQIDRAAQKIIDSSNQRYDEHSHGKLSYLLSLRRVMSKKATAEDLGRQDAINDVLQALNIIEPNKTYLSLIK